MGLFDRFKRAAKPVEEKSVEGSWRGPFFGMGELGGSYEIDEHGDGWQRNLTVGSSSQVPTVYACVMAISRAISQCYPKHVRKSDGNFESITTSAAYRVLKNPNDYQTTPEFLLNLVATALFDGEAFVLGVRNDRNEITQMHLLPARSCSPFVEPESKNIFYSVGSSPMTGEIDYLVPARDILHLKFHTPRSPLIGETAIKAAALAIGINVALNRNQAAFFKQMNRPSGVLTSEKALRSEQIQQLRQAFADQSKGWAAGGIPVLPQGMTWQQLGISSQDAQVVQAQRMSSEEICKVFGVPPPLIGDLSHSTLSNAETMISNFLSLGLGSYLEHVERSFDRFFGIKGNEYIELDTAALLRTDFEGRINGLAKAIQGGLMTPNEGRSREGLSPIEGGDSAYLQRQMIPVDVIGQVLQNEIERSRAPEPTPEPPSDAENNEEVKFDGDVAAILVKNMIAERKAKGTH